MTSVDVSVHVVGHEKQMVVCVGDRDGCGVGAGVGGCCVGCDLMGRVWDDGRRGNDGGPDWVSVLTLAVVVAGVLIMLWVNR